MEITRYAVQEKRLVPWVKFFWKLNTIEHSISQKLLPTESIDILINLGDPIVYTAGSNSIIAPQIHINGFRSQYSFIHQSGNIHIWGISFYSYGLYPFIQSPITKIKDKIADLRELSEDLTVMLESVLYEKRAAAKLESILLSMLNIDDEIILRTELLSRFLTSEEQLTVKSFCAANDINVKTFERLCVRYTGYTPAILRRIHRFQAVSNQIVHEKPDSLADAAYNNRFADQAHLNREFKVFAGEAPGRFTQQKASVKENVQYKYE